MYLWYNCISISNMAGSDILKMPLIVIAVYASQEGVAIDVHTKVVVEPLGPPPRGVEGTHVADGRAPS